MYRYFGILLGHIKASVALLSVVGLTTGGHGAVWLGASNPQTTHWVQAGVETTGGSDPGYYLYIEIGGGSRASLTTWPTTPGHVAHVRLIHHGSYWKVRIDGHESLRIWLPNGSTTAVLEDMSPGPMSSVATINGKQVRGH